MVLAIGFVHDLLHPAGRQFVADLHLRGVPDQRPRLRLRPVLRRPAECARLSRYRRSCGSSRGYGLNAVFVVIAVIVAIAAIAVTQVGPEARGLALDEIAPPTA